MPRSASSVTRPRNVKSRLARSTSQSRCAAKTPTLCPPILPGVALPVARCRPDQRTTVAALMLNTAATDRTLSPASTRATARSRRSIEYGLLIAAGLHTQPAASIKHHTNCESLIDPLQRHPALVLLMLQSGLCNFGQTYPISELHE